jgi:proline iminopeptidase
MASPSAHAWQWMYPPVQCHSHGWLDAGDGHEIHWDVSGNPMGVPALFVHGGPGAGCSADDRRWFDPRRYRIVSFDQRGAGRSRPQGELRGNTTDHLVRDIEALRIHLGVERWLLFGGSWGATLSLAYAQCHADRVLGLVLRGVFTATAGERQWLYTEHGAAALYPRAWQALMAAISPSRHAEPLEALAANLHCGDPLIEQGAARAWLRWEHDLMDLEWGEAAKGVRAPADGVALAAARIGVHYAQHRFFLDEGELLQRAHTLCSVPGVIVQGARDQVTPPAAATALNQVWPGSRLVRVAQGGHASSHPHMARELIAATDGFRDSRAGVACATQTSARASSTTTETSDERDQIEQ